MKTTCTLKSLLARGCDLGGKKTAVIAQGRSFTFHSFSDRIGKMSLALINLGLHKGERVAFLSRNSIEGAELYFSVPCAGLTLVVLNFRLAVLEIRSILQDSTPSVLFVDEEFYHVAEEICKGFSFIKYTVCIGSQKSVLDGWLHYEQMLEGAGGGHGKIDVAEDDLAVLMYTSGTTGIPKGCKVAHRNLFHSGHSMCKELAMGEDDVCLIPAPMFHASGQCCLMNSVYSGVPAVIMSNWDVETFMRLVEAYQVTTALIPTPMLMHLVNYPSSFKYDFSSLKKVLFAGAPVSSTLFERAIRRFGNIFIHGYGTTETVGTISMLKLEEVRKALVMKNYKKLDSCGRGFSGMEMEVVNEKSRLVEHSEVGTIRVRGKGLTCGYWNQRADVCDSFHKGWFYTGDMAKFDEEGFLYIVGRRKDMIISGAENVFPAEIENILLKHPAIEQAAVIGLEDEKWGEEVTAFIVTRPGQAIAEEEVKTFCRGYIAGYKVPKKVFFIDCLPVSATGKLLKNKLVTQAA